MNPIILYRFLYIFFILFILSIESCSSKKASQDRVDVKRIKNPIKILSAKIAKRLDIKPFSGDISKLETLDEITLIQKKHYIKIILNGHIFEEKSARTVPSARNIIEALADLINGYKHLDIRVYGHSPNSVHHFEKKSLSDNRAISIAQIIYTLDNQNDTLAKGCADKIPLFTPDSKEHIISNGRVEIYIY